MVKNYRAEIQTLIATAVRADRIRVATYKTPQGEAMPRLILTVEQSHIKDTTIIEIPNSALHTSAVVRNAVDVLKFYAEHQERF